MMVATACCVLALLAWRDVTNLRHVERRAVARHGECQREAARQARIAERLAALRAERDAARAKAAAVAPDDATTDDAAAEVEEEDDSVGAAQVQRFGRGIRVGAFLASQLENVRPDGSTEFVTPGREGIIARGGVTVLNLWATWCEPCKRELPRLDRALRAVRRAERVRFVPLLIDNANPRSAAREFREQLPSHRHFLVDRAGAVRDTLGVAGLFRDDLPVTMLFDCRRRVRWIHFGEVDDGGLAELGAAITALTGELQGSRCQTSRCGDGACEGQETAASCPVDCGGARCGDGRCEGAESPETCLVDCGRCRCGDGRCETRCETKRSCPADCACGDGVCDAGESRDCPRDCPRCGDGTCQPGAETLLGCPADCRPTAAKLSAFGCGNGRCEAFESCRTCKDDCPCAGACLPSGACCGDGACDGPRETCAVCPADCGACAGEGAP